LHTNPPRRSSVSAGAVHLSARRALVNIPPRPLAHPGLVCRQSASPLPSRNSGSPVPALSCREFLSGSLLDGGDDFAVPSDLLLLLTPVFFSPTSAVAETLAVVSMPMCDFLPLMLCVSHILSPQGHSFAPGRFCVVHRKIINFCIDLERLFDSDIYNGI